MEMPRGEDEHPVRLSSVGMVAESELASDRRSDARVAATSMICISAQGWGFNHL
jgi:hypothetical protein